MPDGFGGFKMEDALKVPNKRGLAFRDWVAFAHERQRLQSWE